jgi:serine/threonine protein kinase
VDQGIRREVAIKFLLNHADENDKSRFIEEAQITGQLEHPNIVPIHQLGVHQDGRCFFSMKMVKGRSLADILREQGQEAGKSAYSLVRLLNIFTSVCNAVAYAHSQGVIHRDLKPANVMVGQYGEVYVMDWGLAKPLGQEPAGSTQQSGSGSGKVVTGRAVDANLTQAGAVLGTPSYMPPEQAMGEAVDQRSDIYSLGAILYEILTLSPPVGRGGDHLAILMRVAEGDIRPPEKQAPQRARQGWIPPELSAVAMKALAKDPAQRYQRVEDLQRDIQLYLEGRSVSAKRDSGWELFRKLIKRNRGVSAATAAALVVLAAVMGVAYYSNYQQRVQAEIAREQAVQAQQKAEENYQAFLQEQKEKTARIRKSAPAFLRAAQRTADQIQFSDALIQANIAIDSDPSLSEAYLLKGQLLFALRRYAEAVAPLRDYLARKPGELAASKLLRLAEQPSREAPYLWEVGRVFEEQKFHGGMWQLNKEFTERVESLKARLPGYRKMIDAGSPELLLGKHLQLTREGTLRLGVWDSRIRDLEALKGIPIHELYFRGLSKFDGRLDPLRGMPLTALHFFDGGNIKSLDALGGMKLTNLLLRGAGPFTDLKPLKNMPLEKLILHFSRIQDLGPLKGAPLKSLDLGDCQQFRTIAPLGGMKLTYLSLWGCNQVTDLGPLGNMPLEELHIGGLTGVRDFTPLKGLVRLKMLRMWNTAIEDLTVLKDLPLTELNLDGCKKITTLEPLRDMKQLVNLNVARCTQLKDYSVLGQLPLQILTISPKAIRKEDMEMFRGMKTLTMINVPGTSFITADFWKKYDAGELK